MPLREVVDHHGYTWQVFDVHPTGEYGLTVSAQLAKGWLCFQCGLDRRRAAPIPQGWDDLDDVALLRLMVDKATNPFRRKADV